MSTESATIIELRRLRPVKWSAIDKKTQTYRDNFVHTYLEFEGRELLEEDGTSMLDGQGRRRTVSMRAFASRYGIGQTTFKKWVFEARGYKPVTESRPTTDWNPSESVTSRVTTGRGYTRAPGHPFDQVLPHAEQHGQCSHCPEWKES